MSNDRSATLGDPEWRAAAWGIAGAVALLLGGLVVGLVQGNLLPGDCQGLACLFSGLILGYAGVVLVIWVLAGVAIALARKRWPTSTWRLWLIRGLAALSWVPFAGLIVLTID